jgi:superfamily I DNA/RNA helicase
VSEVKTFTPNRYQEAIFQFIREDTQNAVIEAVAGSGKTTTIVEAVKCVPENQRILFCAFNKHIAEACRQRITSPNCKVQTLNALGWGYCMRNLMPKPVLQEDKTRQILKTRILNLNEPAQGRFYSVYSQTIVRLVSLGKTSNFKLSSELTSAYRNMAYRQGLELGFTPEDDPELTKLFEEKLAETFDACATEVKVLDFDDQLYFPLRYNWLFPQYDVVFVDEAQDLNRAQIDMVLRIARRIIAVGDPYQAIYGFRGADPEAIPNLIKATNAVTLPLSISYRCPKAVVRQAQRLVPHIESAEDAEEGCVERIRGPFEGFVPGDYVLCRITAPLVRIFFSLLRRKIPAAIKGKDIAQQLLRVVETVIESFHAPPTLEKFLVGLTEYQNKRAKKILLDTAALAALSDKIEAIRIVAENCTAIDELSERIKGMFVENDSEGVTLSTIHRAKGLEAKTIYILHPELLPHPKATQSWQLTQERNLEYVAITRAMKTLVWIDTPKRREY